MNLQLEICKLWMLEKKDWPEVTSQRNGWLVISHTHEIHFRLLFKIEGFEEKMKEGKEEDDGDDRIYFLAIYKRMKTRIFDMKGKKGMESCG